MNINMSEDQFNKIIKLCQNSKNEFSGIMNTRVKEDEIYVVGIELDTKDLIEEANSHEIIYNSKEYITKTVYELAFVNSPVYIRFHTHPSSRGLPGLSKADTESLKYVQTLATKVKKVNSSATISVIEGIVTESEIAFYTYNLEEDRVMRVPFFVDGIEKIPSIEKTKFQIFKDSFLEGMKKGKR